MYLSFLWCFHETFNILPLKREMTVVLLARFRKFQVCTVVGSQVFSTSSPSSWVGDWMHSLRVSRLTSTTIPFLIHYCRIPGYADDPAVYLIVRLTAPKLNLSLNDLQKVMLIFPVPVFLGFFFCWVQLRFSGRATRESLVFIYLQSLAA